MPTSACIPAALAVTLLAAACGDSNGTDPEPATCGPEVTAVGATVTTGSTVDFDWEPGCEVFYLQVEGSGGPQWGLIVPAPAVEEPADANLIAPPVRYGQDPTGLIERTRPPEELQPGSSYQLLLWRLVPGATAPNCDVDIADACLVARVTFRR